jgi:HipA-like protein
MLEQAKKLIKFLNKYSEDRHETLNTPKDIHAEFKLKYKNLTIGYLILDEGVWEFSYSEEFKNQDELRPIVQFPDKEKKYVTEELWPFFTIRIPGLNQPEIQHIMQTENIDKSNEVELLERFGKKTISDPYRLVGAA